MSGANAVRGEVDIDLGGVSYPLRPSFEAIVAAEQATGLPLTDMAMAADKGSLTITQASIIVTEFIQAYGKRTKTVSMIGAKREKIAKLIFDLGVMVAMPRIAIVLFQAATGGVTESGEVKAMPETTKATTADVSPASPPPPLDGQPTSSGKPRRTSSSPRSRRGKK